MNKIKVRCFNGYGVSNMLHNIELFITLPGFGYNKKLYTCSSCGELFVVDLEDPKMQMIKDLKACMTIQCPQCNSNLGETLLPYPENVVLPKGSVVRIDKTNLAKKDDDGIVMDFWLLNSQIK